MIEDNLIWPVGTQLNWNILLVLAQEVVQSIEYELVPQDRGRMESVCEIVTELLFNYESVPVNVGF